MEGEIKQPLNKEQKFTGDAPLWLKTRDNLTIQKLSQEITKLQDPDGVEQLKGKLTNYYWDNGIPHLSIENDNENSEYWISKFKWSFEAESDTEGVTKQEDKSIKTKIRNILKIPQEPTFGIDKEKLKSLKATSAEGIKIGRYGSVYCLADATQAISPLSSEIKDLGDGKFILTASKNQMGFSPADKNPLEKDASITVKALSLEEKAELTKKRITYKQLLEKLNTSYDDKERMGKEYQIQEQLLYEVLKIEGIELSHVTKKTVEEDDDYSIHYNFAYKDVPLKIELDASSRLQFFEFPDAKSESKSKSISVSSDNISWSLPIVLTVLDKFKTGDIDFLNEDEEENNLFISSPGKFSTSTRSAGGVYGTFVTFNRLDWELNDKNEIVQLK